MENILYQVVNDICLMQDKVHDGECIRYNFISMPRYIENFKHIVEVKDKIQYTADIGTGWGVMALAVKYLGKDAIAIDFWKDKSELFDLLEIPLYLKNIELGMPPELLKGQFDCVMFCEILEHLNFSPVFVLQEINKMLRPGGYIIISTPNNEEWNLKELMEHNDVSYLTAGGNMRIDADVLKIPKAKPGDAFFDGHTRHYVGEEIIRLLKYTGFKVDKIKYILDKKYIDIRGIKI